MSPRDVVITGIGLVSALGEGNEAHWRKLTAAQPEPVVDQERFPPYSIHPLPEIDWGLQIPKRGDQRQMETWQRLGTYAAGLALDDAGMKGDDALCSTMDMVIAAAGGERDEAVDTAILSASRSRPDVGVLLNEKLTTELRPTLFLAQLSNLLAGNISIVHKVTGSSRTFMGEEGSGVSAIDTAAARIRSGQSTHALVGAALNSDHPDTLLSYELGGYLHRGSWRPVWDRAGSEGGGVVSGSGSAFLVLESREHAEKRGVAVYAKLAAVASDNAGRKDGLADAVETLLRKVDPDGRSQLAVSGASGAHQATKAEREALELFNLPVRAFSTLTGHIKEAQFPFAVALAALAIKHGSAYPPFDRQSEKDFAGNPQAVLATAIGFYRYEGAALVTKA
ncbi:beta-ketoacyl-ACP synthase [Mesorhizobium sp. BAC0120]|uniref:beta-ketoacyl-ACP synthase n=1 Tax=Mesorhizobium sp. BAC0120 TaxID=3090670 RepID=UPI00298BDBC9|nr:beta-ketoacyl-ACP synthase [Mesorhizobium sp. BAC0120]MDW6020423.1 beta-ketoacyl-ACP synthase [Mesorhizobium sp. BAC0120]